VSAENDGNQCDQSESVVDKAIIAESIPKTVLQISGDRQGDQGTVKEAPHQPDQSEESVLHRLFQLCFHQLACQLGHGADLRAKKLFVEGVDPP